jgi:hypothetical protein
MQASCVTWRMRVVGEAVLAHSATPPGPVQRVCCVCRARLAPGAAQGRPARGRRGAGARRSMPPALIFRKTGARRRYFPPFQPWGLLHGARRTTHGAAPRLRLFCSCFAPHARRLPPGAVVTVSGVLFWVGVWDILDYAVLPRGWQWRVRPVRAVRPLARQTLLPISRRGLSRCP